MASKKKSPSQRRRLAKRTERKKRESMRNPSTPKVRKQVVTGKAGVHTDKRQRRTTRGSAKRKAINES